MNKFVILCLLLGCTTITIDNSELNNKCDEIHIDIPENIPIPIDKIENTKSYKEKYDLLLNYTLSIKKQQDKLKTDIREYNQKIKSNCYR